MKKEAVEEVIYGCIRGLDGRALDCKLAMHANCFIEIQKKWFLILVAGIMVEAIDWTDSKVVAITALGIIVFTQMVNGGSWKCFATKKTLLTFYMDVSFAWSPFLMDECHQ